jgi:hypothetical protein
MFEHNDMIYNNTLEDTNSFLIETLGPLIMDRTCFNHNLVGVSNVAVFGNSFTPSSMSISNSTGRVCEFAAVFETLQQLEQLAPLCVLALSPSCVAKDTPSPSSMPTRTFKPTDRPTTKPTSRPSTAPTATPTVTPGEPTATPKELVPTLTPVPTIVEISTEQPYTLPLDQKPNLETNRFTPAPHPNPFVFPGNNKRPSLFSDDFPESGYSGRSHFWSVLSLTVMLYLLA